MLDYSISVQLLTEHHLEFSKHKSRPHRLVGIDTCHNATLLEITCHGSFGPRREKICLWGFAKNTGADQPAHPRSLISAFVIRFFESAIFNLATGEISFFYLVSVAEETGLKLALSETPKTGFLVTQPIYISGTVYVDR